MNAAFSTVSVGWFRMYSDAALGFTPGTYKVVFIGCIDWVPSKTAVVDDFGNLVGVPK